MGNADGEGAKMKCDLCSGQYVEKKTVLSLQKSGQTVVVEDVPALVCDLCGDRLYSESTFRRVHELLEEEPGDAAPLYRFPSATATVG